MGTDGACGLLFCAAKRSGAFPPNMPALFLVLLVNDSEYSQSAGAKPIFKSLLAVFI